jgi:hypothetical protein
VVGLISDTSGAEQTPTVCEFCGFEIDGIDTSATSSVAEVTDLDEFATDGGVEARNSMWSAGGDGE